MVEIFLIAVSLALDAFAVSVSSGISIPGFGPRQAVKMGLWFGTFQFLMPLLGWLLGSAELLINAVMFCLVLWQDPHRIGLGTLANMVLVGYTADFFGWVFRLYGITAPTGGAARFVFMVAAMLILPAILGVTGAWLATPAAEAAAFLLSAVMFIKYRKKYQY